MAMRAKGCRHGTGGRIRAAILAASLVGLAPGIAGCGKPADAEDREEPGEAARKRNETARKRFVSVEKRLAKLPQYTPEQRVAFEDIKREYAVIKINFEAKSKARIGMVTQDVFHDTMVRLDSLEKKLAKYPH